MARIRPRPAIDWDSVSEDNTVLHQQPSLPNPPPPPRAGSGPPVGGGSTTWRSGTPLPAPLRQQDDEVVANRPGSYCPATFPPVAASHLLVPAFIVCIIFHFITPHMAPVGETQGVDQGLVEHGRPLGAGSMHYKALPSAESRGMKHSWARDDIGNEEHRPLFAGGGLRPREMSKQGQRVKGYWGWYGDV